MCCFSGPVEYVSNTRIFARRDNGHQVLAYAMSLGTKVENAMILPIPVAVGAGEEAVRFTNLERYPQFFDNMDSLFHQPLSEEFGAVLGAVSAAASVLEVHSVGSFEASYVPSIPDFERLDLRFRLPQGVWHKLPKYRDYGFAVFQLKPGRMDVHPMAFRFPTRLPGELFFPTVHIHDGTFHAKANFDHFLYAQKPEGMSWLCSGKLAREKMKVSGFSWQGTTDLTQGLVVGDLPVYRRVVRGSFPNRDVHVPGWEPEVVSSSVS